MKRFVWRLQKVLDIKAKEEQFKRMELFRLTEAMAEKRAELLMRQRTVRKMLADVARVPAADRLQMQELVLRHAAINDRHIHKLQDELSALQTRQKETLREVIAARRFKEELEKLRGEAQERYIEEQEKLEQKESDDRTTIAFARNEGIRP